MTKSLALLLPSLVVSLTAAMALWLAWVSRDDAESKSVYVFGGVGVFCIGLLVTAWMLRRGWLVGVMWVVAVFGGLVGVWGYKMAKAMVRHFHAMAVREVRWGEPCELGARARVMRLDSLTLRHQAIETRGQGGHVVTLTATLAGRDESGPEPIILSTHRLYGESEVDVGEYRIRLIDVQPDDGSTPPTAKVMVTRVPTVER